MERPRFARLVRQALDDLPAPFSHWLSNVDVVVEPRVRPHHRRSAGLRPGETLFGLYEGLPQTERMSDYGMMLPDRITIFQEPLVRAFKDEAKLVLEVRRTMLHELAHHFGLSDEELQRIGLD
jgi:predicted Zn-dependent protease with MMP-like domain